MPAAAPVLPTPPPPCPPPPPATATADPGLRSRLGEMAAACRDFTG